MVDEGDESGSTRTAGSVARSLAGSGNGLVASFRRADADVARARIEARALPDARTLSLLRALREQVIEVREEVIAADDGPVEIAFELPAARAGRWLSEPPRGASLTSVTEIADALAGAQRSTKLVGLEDRLALRRLVLEPLLDASPTSPTVPFAVTQAAAAMLGYVLLGPSKLADGSDALLLLPGSAPRPIAVLARTGGVRGVVVEAPHGAHAGLRALGVDLAATLHADALLVGLESDGRLFGNETLRDAHVAATWPQPERETRVVVLRSAAVDAVVVDEPDTTVGAFPVLGSESLLATVEAALRDAGVRARRAPLDLAAREEAGRSFFGDTQLVEITAGQKALEGARLGSALVATRELASLPMYDATCADVVRKLEADLPSDGATAPLALLDIARRAAVERSIVARRALENAVATSASRAALARTERAVYLVVVARTGRRTMLVAAIPVLAGFIEPPTPSLVPTVEACLPFLVAGGQCQVESR